jgi:hypothetical protein
LVQTIEKETRFERHVVKRPIVKEWLWRILFYVEVWN